MGLEDLRNELDKVDDELIEVFKKRMDITRKIGRYKKVRDYPIRDRNRENEIIKRLESKVEEDYKFAIEPLYEKIFQLSKEYQKDLINNIKYSPEEYYGLIGKTLSHSKSPNIHEIIGGYEYELYPMDEVELENFLGRRQFSGMNVTIPYKVEVMKYIDEISSLAKEIGSVNTIVNKKGKLFGYNTDYSGFEYMCEKANITLKGKNVMILGSGGASKTVQALLRDEKAKSITVISRSGENNYDNIYDFKDTEIIVNTTPVGMYPNNLECIVEISQFEKCEAVIDTIYNPLKTKMILNAERMGKKTATGLDMLVSQAYYASKLFLGKEIPIEVVERTIKKVKSEMLNIVLVGMPGSGKTTIGRALAEKLNRKFIDIDEYIEEQEKMTISEIFRTKGENEFRNIESEVIQKFAKENGYIIATGGGTPVYQENSNAIVQNGYVIFLDRDLEKLDRVGRPLSKDMNSLKVLYKNRYNIYIGISNKYVPVKENIEETLDFILRGLARDEIISCKWA